MTGRRPRVDHAWQCGCGEVNVMRVCAGCRRWAPPSAQAREFDDVVLRMTPPPKPSRRATRTAALAIGFGGVMQIVGGVFFAVMPRMADAIRISLVVTLGFYGLVALLVLFRIRGAARPVWTQGRPGLGALLGLGAGIGAAALVTGLNWAISGQASDSFLSLVVSEGTVARVLVMGIIAVVCAPLVEEWLFRGFVAESLRSRGVGNALVISALLFSIWHWNFAGLRYYVLMGLLFGLLYWHRGLVASMSAHAAFNGSLLAIAAVLAHGSAHIVQAEGVSLRAPAVWSEDVAAADGGEVIHLDGPSGAALSVGWDRAKTMNPTELRDEIARHDLGIDGVKTDPRTLQITGLPTGPAVRMVVEWEGAKAVAVAVPRAGRVWTVLVDTAGSPRASADAERILGTLKFPS